MKKSLPFLASLVLGIIGCQAEDNRPLDDGSPDNPADFSSVCMLNIPSQPSCGESSLWREISSPNPQIFPQHAYYASVGIPVENCKYILQGRQDIRINLNASTTADHDVAAKLILAQASYGNITFNPFSPTLTFAGGKLISNIADSKSMATWRPPLIDNKCFYLSFQIPDEIYQKFQHYPSGRIYIKQYRN